jgi:hypothetical protein
LEDFTFLNELAPDSRMTAVGAKRKCRHDSLAAIDVAKALARLSKLTIF